MLKMPHNGACRVGTRFSRGQTGSVDEIKGGFRKWSLGLALFPMLLSACVERRMTIVSDPPGAMATVNNQEIGATPVDVPSHHYVYNGYYDIKLVRDGYEPLLVKQAVPPRWYQVFPLEFISEDLIPWHIKDKRVFEFRLLPEPTVPSEELLRRAEAQRSRGQGIGHPPVTPGMIAPPASPNPPALRRGLETGPSPSPPVRLEPPVEGP